MKDNDSRLTQFDKQLVDLLLSINTANRRINKAKLEQYKKDIMEGDFDTVCYTSKILVNKSWTKLIDGQTRLTAIKECGYPEFLMDLQEVPDDLAERVMEHVDQGRNRSIGDIYDIKGEHLPGDRNFAAVLSALIRTGLRPSLKASVTFALFHQTRQRFEKVITRTYHLRSVTGADRPTCAAIAVCGVVHAILLNPQNEGEILKRWKDVRDGELTFPSAKHLRRLIKESCRKDYEKVFAAKICKGLSCPNLGVLRLGDEEADNWLFRFSVDEKANGGTP